MLSALAICGNVATREASRIFTPTIQGKKYINYGWDKPTTAYVKAHIREMEKSPYDGVGIVVSPIPNDVDGKGDYIGKWVFHTEPFRPEQYEHAIADLEATEFRRFTDNFIQIKTMPGIDMLDEAAWATTLYNCRIMARIAKRGGCVGLLIDAECYPPPRRGMPQQSMWSYIALPEDTQEEYSRERYAEFMRSRGREFIRALNREFPGIRLLWLYGASSSLKIDPLWVSFNMLAPFTDGMCQAADEGTLIYDGREQTYGIRTADQFAEHRRIMIQDSRNLFTDKTAFDRVMRVGFAVWLDVIKPWYSDQPEKNYYSVDGWQTTVHHALAYSDGYVWNYNHYNRWWKSEIKNDLYKQADFNARNAPGKPEPPITDPRKYNVESPAIPRAGPLQEKDWFDDLFDRYDELMTLPAKGWKFRTDPDRTGIDKEWFRLDLPTTGWVDFEIEKFWEEQGDAFSTYDGVGWYRLEFDIDDVPLGKEIIVAFGAVDEGARVWANGQKIGTFDVGGGGWLLRFTLDATGKIKSGRNQITVRVLDRWGAGGIWRPIKIMAAK
jgi:hypothetical protein